MGIQSSIYIYHFNEIDIKELFNKIENSKMEIHKDGYITYLPMNDLDYNYQIESRDNYKLVKDICIKKSQLKQPIGFNLYDQGECFEVLLIPQSNTIIIGLPERIYCMENNILDYSYYLSEILLIININNVSKIECLEDYR
jgi:hypothetical protein